ncbi:MAG: Gfo/Idh/MocA family protein [Armatimonadota bacterium]
MAKKLKYGLIGCGGCGVGKHLAAYARYTDEIELYAVYDFEEKNAQAAAEKYDVPHVFTSYEAMLADKKLDVVSVVTPNAYHAPITIAALNAGKHVHVEKPIALNAEEAQAIVDAKNASGKLVMVGLNNRFTEVNQFAKQYIEEGNLGEIYHARCGWRRRRGIPGRGGWFTTKALSGGGPVIDLGVHFFDLTLFFMGFPEPVSVSASTYCKFANAEVSSVFAAANTAGTFDVEDFAAGFAKLETGASVAFEFSWASNIEKEVNYFELLGTKGGMSMYNGELKIFSESCGQIVDVLPHVRNTSGWGENETRHFIDCIKLKKQPIAPPEDAVKMMKIIDAIYTSSESGREVALAAMAV